MQAPSFITAVFLSLAELHVKQKRPLQAVEWIGLLLAQPALPYFKAQAQELLEALQASLSPQDVEEALGRGRYIRLEDVPQMLKEQHAFEQLPLVELEPPSQLTHTKLAPNVLTERETQVLRLVAEGLTNKGIASSLGISEKTVARHLENVFNKLGVSSRAAATAFAVREGILPDRRTGETG